MQLEKVDAIISIPDPLVNVNAEPTELEARFLKSEESIVTDTSLAVMYNAPKETEKLENVVLLMYNVILPAIFNPYHDEYVEHVIYVDPLAEVIKVNESRLDERV